MDTLKTVGQSRIIAAKLAAVMFICTGLTITTIGSSSNTSILFSRSKTFAPVYSVSVPVTTNAKARSDSRQEREEFENRKNDKTAGMLSAQDAQRYRTIFAALRQGDLKLANAQIPLLQDRSLLGHALALHYQVSGATPQALLSWLRLYADHPEAETIYAAAQKAWGNAHVNLPKPAVPAPWSPGAELNNLADFATLGKSDAHTNHQMQPSVRAIMRALHQGNVAKARDLLIAAQAKQPLVGTVAADTLAAVAAGFFYQGERDQALALANAAAVAQNPLGLWIKGLIAWEQQDFGTASASFEKLATHPALDDCARSAAYFWAYRSEKANGKNRQAAESLRLAAHENASFYGMLAHALLGRPLTFVPGHQQTATPVWSNEYRDVVASSSQGRRALALVQVGEKGLAENVLRRLNPQGRPRLQKAMLALASYADMPSLAVQIASLYDESARRTALLHPLLPWKPQDGFRVDRALIFALARHESLFDPTAISSRGALGLMQLMPTTANRMAQTDSAETFDESRLLDPAYNLALGQKYVRRLAQHPKIGDNLLLLLAAYNGGPNKVARWLDEREARQQQALDPLFFVESFSPRETRRYMMRVLAHYWIYQLRLNEPLTSIRELAQGQWPRVPMDAQINIASK